MIIQLIKTFALVVEVTGTNPRFVTFALYLSAFNDVFLLLLAISTKKMNEIIINIFQKSEIGAIRLGLIII